jgi:hypothetical protein
MPFAIDAPISRPVQRISSVSRTQPFDIGRSTPVLHGTRPWWRWLRTLGQRTESAMDRLAREEPYRFIQVSLW